MRYFACSKIGVLAYRLNGPGEAMEPRIWTAVPDVARGRLLRRWAWDAHANARAARGGALHLERPAEVCRAFSHRTQTEMTGEGPLGVKPDAVVRYLERNLAIAARQSQIHLASAGMLD